jgi:hypothetical protein
LLVEFEELFVEELLPDELLLLPRKISLSVLPELLLLMVELFLGRE